MAGRRPAGRWWPACSAWRRPRTSNTATPPAESGMRSSRFQCAGDADVAERVEKVGPPVAPVDDTVRIVPARLGRVAGVEEFRGGAEYDHRGGTGHVRSGLFGSERPHGRDHADLLDVADTHLFG